MPGHDQRFVSIKDQSEEYSEGRGLASARCADCALFYAYDDLSYGGQGECRALPPRFVQDGLEGGAWPRISASDWCGEFLPGGDA